MNRRLLRGNNAKSREEKEKKKGKTTRQEYLNKDEILKKTQFNTNFG